MANTFIAKRSSVSGKVPLATDLQVGELALNLADAKIYSKNSAGTVIQLSGTGDVTTAGPTGPAGQGVPIGGSTGQTLIKKSSTDYDTEWGEAMGDYVPIVGGETGAALLPRGTTAQRPADPVNGMMRYNETLRVFEYYANGEWVFGNVVIQATDYGEASWTAPGTYTWVVPAGVTAACAVCVGGGARGGGGLGWVNNISLVPGASATIVVGAGTPATGSVNGGNSTLTYAGSVRCSGGGGSTTTGGNVGGGFVGTGGGSGGQGGATSNYVGGGGGAGGYSGNGGIGGAGTSINPGTAGAGGGGGSGGQNVGGGGVGVYGQGANGAAGGYGGSGGSNGTTAGGGIFGGGAGSGSGGSGAVRIIWGPNRAFPSTNTGYIAP